MVGKRSCRARFAFNYYALNSIEVNVSANASGGDKSQQPRIKAVLLNVTYAEAQAGYSG